jgi:hypothetical protein
MHMRDRDGIPAIRRNLAGGDSLHLSEDRGRVVTIAAFATDADGHVFEDDKAVLIFGPSGF